MSVVNINDCPTLGRFAHQTKDFAPMLKWVYMSELILCVIFKQSWPDLCWNATESPVKCQNSCIKFCRFVRVYKNMFVINYYPLREQLIISVILVDIDYGNCNEYKIFHFVYNSCSVKFRRELSDLRCMKYVNPEKWDLNHDTRASIAGNDISWGSEPLHESRLKLQWYP